MWILQAAQENAEGMRENCSIIKEIVRVISSVIRKLRVNLYCVDLAERMKARKTDGNANVGNT